MLASVSMFNGPIGDRQVSRSGLLVARSAIPSDRSFQLLINRPADRPKQREDQRPGANGSSSRQVGGATWGPHRRAMLWPPTQRRRLAAGRGLENTRAGCWKEPEGDELISDQLGPRRSRRRATRLPSAFSWQGQAAGS